jgi:hypothetical protein
MQQFVMNSFIDMPFAPINLKAVQLSTWWTGEVWNKIKFTAQGKKLKALIPSWGKDKTLQSLLLENKSKQLNWIKSSISQGLIQGKSVQNSTRLVQNAVDMSKRNAMRIVRTETLRNVNGADYLNHLETKNIVETNRQWVSVLDSRTRPQSAAMDGQYADDDDLFHYPNGAVAYFPGSSGVPEYDINERCTVINVIPGEEPSLRRAKNPNTGTYEIIEDTTFTDWADKNNLEYKNGRWAVVKE